MDSLNVVFHGTFAFLNWKSTLEVLAPIVKDHAYLGGTWRREKELVQGETYALVGVTAESTMPPLEALRIPVISRKGKKKVNRNSDVVFCSFILPPPAQFVALNCSGAVTKNDRDGGEVGLEPLFAGKDATATTKKMTLVGLALVLVYETPDVSAITVPGLKWRPKVQAGVEGKGKVANLHFFAERHMPKGKMKMSSIAHRADAFRQLVRVLNADLKISSEVKKYDFGLKDCPGVQDVYGLDPDESVTLYQREELGGGGDPAACASAGDAGN
jgi:hypothetical protein